MLTAHTVTVRCLSGSDGRAQVVQAEGLVQQAVDRQCRRIQFERPGRGNHDLGVGLDRADQPGQRDFGVLQHAVGDHDVVALARQFGQRAIGGVAYARAVAEHFGHAAHGFGDVFVAFQDQNILIKLAHRSPFPH